MAFRATTDISSFWRFSKRLLCSSRLAPNGASCKMPRLNACTMIVRRGPSSALRIIIEDTWVML